MSVQDHRNRCFAHTGRERGKYACLFELPRSLHRFHQEVEQQQTAILLTEEALLEALCFDFVTTSPHVILVDIFDMQQASTQVQDYAWSLAHDS